MEDAVRRLAAAVEAAEMRLEAGTPPDTDDLFGDDRAALVARIAELERKAKEDAALRLEAAEAVKAALADLRTAHATEHDMGAPDHA